MHTSLPLSFFLEAVRDSLEILDDDSRVSKYCHELGDILAFNMKRYHIKFKIDTVEPLRSKIKLIHEYCRLEEDEELNLLGLKQDLIDLWQKTKTLD